MPVHFVSPIPPLWRGFLHKSERSSCYNRSMLRPKTVLIFGTFDGLHEGHRFFLSEARKLGERLIASVAQDSTVERFKKRSPKQGRAERMAALMQNGLVDEAVAGDVALGNWSAVKKYAPHIVALGYDQTKLEEKLREFIMKEKLSIEVMRIEANDPNRLHSRFLREKE